MKSEENKRKLLDALKNTLGIVTPACEMAGISTQTYYNWRKSDPAFRGQCDEILERQGDYVESKLMELIQSGDTTATIFYCKTKLKNRGYNEKAAPTKKENLPDIPKASSKEIKKKVEAKKRYLVKLLKDQGKYSVELSMQITIAAQLLVKTENIFELISAEGSDPIHREYSREGNERQSISALERLYMEYSTAAQRALRAAGMNTDSRVKIEGADELSAFLKKFGDDERPDEQ